MSTVSLKDLDGLIKPLSKYYDEQQTQQAIKSLKQWYQQEAFDNDDIKNDWIPNDFKNCHGIEILVDKLSHLKNKQLSKKVNSPQNKRILFQWICYWLLKNKPIIVTKPKQSPFNTHIGKIAIQLQPKLRSLLQTAESDQIVEYFEKICREEAYTEVQDLQGDFVDFENIDNSYILQEIIEKFDKYASKKEEIFQLIHSIINDGYIYDPFDLRSVDFKYRDSKESFNAAKELCLTEMEAVFKGASKEYESKTNQTNEDTVDTQLIHAKALDFENRFPFLMCMIDHFSRWCCDENRRHWVNSKYNLKPAKKQEQDLHISVTQTAANWLTDIGFGKFFISKHAETAQRYGVAMQSMMNRLLPRIQLNYVLSDTIFDSLDIFSRYALAMNKFVQQLNCESMVEKQFFPCQIDFWIIPRLTKKQQYHNNMISNDLFDVSLKDLGININTNFSGLKFSNMKKKDTNINCFGKSNNNHNASIWNLEDNLKESGYMKNRNYFVLSENKYDHDIDPFCVQKIVKKFWKLWSQNGSWNMERYKRYIVIVDRRNPIHIESKTMVDDTNKDQTWNDKFYLIKPKKCNEISKHFEYKLSECFAGNFKDYLFPVPQLRTKDVDNDFLGLDSGNGYKFALSYHIQFKHKIKVYWSFGQGAQRFFIDDVEWLWPRYFNLINIKETQFKHKTKAKVYQSLSQETKNELREGKYKLCDEQFVKFRKQVQSF